MSHIIVIIQAWAVDGTSVDDLEEDYFCEAIADIRSLVIKKLKEY